MTVKLWFLGSKAHHLTHDQWGDKNFDEKIWDITRLLAVLISALVLHIQVLFLSLALNVSKGALMFIYFHILNFQIFLKKMKNRLTQWHFFYDGSVEHFYYIYRQL